MSATPTQSISQSSSPENEASVACLTHQINKLFKSAAPNMTSKEKTALDSILLSISCSVLAEAKKATKDTASKVKEAKDTDDQAFQELMKKTDGILKGVKKESNVKDCFNIHLATVEAKIDVLKLHHEKQLLKSDVGKLKEKLREMELINENDLNHFGMSHEKQMDELELARQIKSCYLNVRP